MSALAPRLSVAIRAYNQEKEVIRALTSVMEQSYKDPVELVIGVDVSSDNTLSVVQEFCNSLDDRFLFRILAHSERQGGTRNLISVLKLVPEITSPSWTPMITGLTRIRPPNKSR